MKRFNLNIDERSLSTMQKVCTVIYYLNLLILVFILFHRQFVLHQSTREFTDIANLLVFNVIVAVAAILYLGGITFPKMRLRTLFFIYLGFVTVGFLFTLFKYNILLKQSLSVNQIIEKLLIILVLCAGFIFVYGLFAYLGYRKIEKEI